MTSVYSFEDLSDVGNYRFQHIGGRRCNPVVLLGDVAVTSWQRTGSSFDAHVLLGLPDFAAELLTVDTVFLTLCPQV